MQRLKYILTTLITLIIIGLTACHSQSPPAATPTKTPGSSSVVMGNVPATPILANTPVPTTGASSTPTPPGSYGPTGFPNDVNPLTGLVVDDPKVLDRRPILIKVSNESKVVRPQSGLSLADHVWEYQMEGFAGTRFSTIFYSRNAERVGSVRSARLPDIEHLVPMYGAILTFSGGSSNFHTGGSPRVVELTRAKPWAKRVVCPEYIGYGPLLNPYLVRIPDVPRQGVPGYHTLFAVPDEIWRWAEEKDFKQRPNLEGLAFNYALPAGGIPTDEVSIDYPGYGPKHIWRYDEASGRWLSWTDDEPDGDTLLPEGEQLAFDNVVIIYVEHYQADFIEDEPNQLPSVGINLIGHGDAVLLRDGQRFEVTWRRPDVEKMIQFVDATGSVVPFKPGTTWFNTSAIYFPAPEIVFLP